MFLNDSITGVVYNLAFSPKLEYLDLSHGHASKSAEMVEN